MLPEPKRRVRWLTKDEAAALLAALPSHLVAPARFALATGLRQGNIFGLTWDQVDLERDLAWVHADQAKARRAISVPLNAEARGVLQRQIGKDLELCFPGLNGKPLHLRSAVWAQACRRAGLDDFRFHDLRHTWASWHAQRGTPLHVLQELGGWNTPSMVQRYAHLAPEHLRQYVQNSGHSLPNSSAEGTFANA